MPERGELLERQDAVGDWAKSWGVILVLVPAVLALALALVLRTVVEDMVATAIAMAMAMYGGDWWGLGGVHPAAVPGKNSRERGRV